jgi:hypothetical protein
MDPSEREGHLSSCKQSDVGQAYSDSDWLLPPTVLMRLPRIEVVIVATQELLWQDAIIRWKFRSCGDCDDRCVAVFTSLVLEFRVTEVTYV